MLSQNRFDRATALFITLLIVSFALTTMDVRASGEGVAGTMREGAQSIFSPAQKAATSVTRPIVGFFDGLANIAGLRAENEGLRANVLALEGQLDELEQLRARLQELEDLLNLTTPEGIDTVTARVIAVSPSDFDHIRRIDRGLADGITAGMAVIDERGLVGRIVEPVNQNSATIRLITDPLSSVGVVVLRTGETGWVTGQGAGPLVLKMPRAVEELLAGDLLVTGGGRFPADLSVGIVIGAAMAEAGFTLTTTIDPRVSFGRLDFVEVLITTEGVEFIEDIVTDDRLPVDDEPAGDETTDTTPAETP